MSSVLVEDFFERIGEVPAGNNLFFPILIMLEDPTSEISVFFDSSLKSWVLLLRTQPGHSLYTDLAGNEQSDFLLKIAVLTRKNDQKLEMYKINIKKQSESLDSFKQEAELQQNISIDSARYGSREICPPITTFALLINNPATNSMPEASAATEFLRILENKAINQNNAESENVLEVLEYLKNLVMRRIFSFGDDNPPIIILGLGVLVMPRMVGSITVSDYIKSLNHGPIPYTVLAQQAASLLQIVIKQKVIPFDLHTKNQLIDDNLSVKIIDFGRSVGVKPGDVGDEDFLTNSHKAIILNKITEFDGFESKLNRFESHVDTREKYNPRNKYHNQICETVNAILLWVREIELMGNRRRFPGREPVSRFGFIRDIEKMPHEDKCRTLYAAFKIFIDSNTIRDRGVTQRKIGELTELGRIIGFGGVGPETFAVTKIPDNIGGFDISIYEPEETRYNNASGFLIGNSDGSDLESTAVATEIIQTPGDHNLSSFTPYTPFTPHTPFTPPVQQEQQFASPGGANLGPPPAQEFASLFSPIGHRQFGHNQQFGPPNSRGFGGAMSRNKKRSVLKLHKNKTKRAILRKTIKPRKNKKERKNTRKFIK
jgi:hypothetical protein